jgi:DNA-binding MarR family transcriptional regulator
VADGATDVPEELAELLTGVQRLVRRRLRSEATGPRLRGTQVELLRLVGERPGVRVSAAAKELYLAGNTVSTLVNQLVEAGLLRRETAPDDRRAALLHLTPEAVRRLRAWQERRGALVREQVARLPEKDRAALAAAVPALRGLAQGLRDETEGA